MKKLLLSTVLAASFVGAAFAGPQPGVNSPWGITWEIPIDSIKWTYGVGGQLSPLSAQQDLLQLCGAAGTVTRLTRFQISGRATAVASLDIYLVKRSSGTTGGQFAPQTPFLSAAIAGTPYNVPNGAGKATLSAWQTDAGTGGPQTLGTTVGVIAAGMTYLGNLTTGIGTGPLIFDFGVRPTQDVILNSATECLAVNLSGQTNAGNLLNFQIEWTEE